MVGHSGIADSGLTEQVWDHISNAIWTVSQQDCTNSMSLEHVEAPDLL